MRYFFIGVVVGEAVVIVVVIDEGVRPGLALRERSNEVSGVAMIKNKMENDCTMLRYMIWSEKPCLDWEIWPPRIGAPHVVPMTMTLKVFSLHPLSWA